jgi:hypothetical protein
MHLPKSGNLPVIGDFPLNRLFTPVYSWRYERKKIQFCLVLEPEDGIDRLSRNVGKELPLYAAYYPGRAQISSVALIM